MELIQPPALLLLLLLPGMVAEEEEAKVGEGEGDNQFCNQSNLLLLLSLHLFPQLLSLGGIRPWIRYGALVLNCATFFLQSTSAVRRKGMSRAFDQTTALDLKLFDS